MEVILKEDVADLGFRGEVVKVADGYARNYLLPRKLAMQATAANKAVIEQMKTAAARRSASEKAQAEELVTRLEPLVLSFTRKVRRAGPSLWLGHLGRHRRGAGCAGPRDRSPQDPVGRPDQERGRIQGGHPLHREVTARVTVKVRPK